jgi:hypothetical protein
VDYADVVMIESLVAQFGAVAVKAAVDAAVRELAARDDAFPDWELTGDG